MDTGTAYGRTAGSYRRELTEVGAGTPMGELLRRYWHPVGMAKDFSSTPLPVKVLGENLIAFRDGQGKPGLVLPRCARRDALLRQGRGTRHPLLLSRLAVGRARTLPGAALRGRRRQQASRQGAPALVPGRGALWPGLRLPRPAREEAGAAALRLPGRARAGRIHRGRRFLDRRRRPAADPLQLAAALGERGGPVPRADPARLVLRHPIRAADGRHAEGEVRRHA